MNKIKLESSEINTKSKEVVEQIAKAIKAGVYKKGDRLPPERDLAKQLEVSRASLREALSALEITDIIESRPGAGTFVADGDGHFANFTRTALDILNESSDPYIVYEARRVIEEGSASLIIENVTSEDIEKIDREVKRLCQAVLNRDFKEYFDSDRAFHLALGKAIHNPLIENFHRSLLEVVKEDLWQDFIKKTFAFTERKLTDDCEDHRNILKAIKKSSAKDCLEAIRNHFESFDFTHIAI